MKRTADELVSYVEGFLNELYIYFSTNTRVSFKELQIKKNGSKYRLNSRLRCEVMKAEFNESHRLYTRKYNTFPTREAILSWIDAAHELNVIDDRKKYEKNIDKILKREKERRKGRKEQIRQYNVKYYKKNKQRIDEKFKLDKYYEKNKERINILKRARRERIREQKRSEHEKIINFNKEFEKARPAILNFFKTITYEYNDLLQETYLEAFTFRHRYKRNTNMSAWAIGIGRNINLQKLKTRRIETGRVMFVDEFNDDAMANAVSKISLEELFEEENQIKYPENTVEVLNQAIDELTERDRELLELYMEGNKHDEIANILGIDENYSKTRLYLIRIMLAKKVEPKLNIKIKTYGSTNPNEIINRNASRKSYYFRKKQKDKNYGKSINVREKEEETNGRIEHSFGDE